MPKTASLLQLLRNEGATGISKKKTEEHSKLDRLVYVAARLEYLEEELGKATADKVPDEALLTCAGWEVRKQISAEKGQHSREQAAREYEERKAEMHRINNHFINWPRTIQGPVWREASMPMAVAGSSPL